MAALSFQVMDGLTGYFKPCAYREGIACFGTMTCAGKEIAPSACLDVHHYRVGSMDGLLTLLVPQF